MTYCNALSNHHVVVLLFMFQLGKLAVPFIHLKNWPEARDGGKRVIFWFLLAYKIGALSPILFLQFARGGSLSSRFG